jgi:ACS family tartrate transporter-like MFS transporter
MTTSRSDPVVPAAVPVDLARDTPRKVARRLLPFLLLLYIACYLDRVNVGFAALQMNQALGLSAAAYGLGAGVFFIGYCLFEVPSNIVLARVGARRWIARILISWGLISSAMMFVRGPASFYSLRFLLGAAEAGFFPGIIYYLGEWFPSYERARVIARFMVAIPLSGIVGGPLSGALLQLGGRAGLAGWQWLFLLEGIPSVVLGVVSLVYLTDRPEVAQWLASAERAWLTDRLRVDRERSVQRRDVSVGKALSHPMVWQLALQQGLTLSAGLYALSFWLPQIVKEFSGLGDMGVGLITAVPYLTGAVAMVVVGARSDRSGERWLHIAACSLAAAIGFVASALVHTPVLALAALSLATAGVMSAMGPFWALPGTFLSGAAAAAGIALVNSLANVMGFATPYALGLIKDAVGGYTVGLVLLALLPLAGAVLALRLRRAPLFVRGLRPLASPVTP